MQDVLNIAEGITDITNLKVAYQFDDRWALNWETSYLTSDYALDVPLEPAIPGSFSGGRTVDDTAANTEVRLLYETDRLSTVFGTFYRVTEKDLFFRAVIPDASVFGFPPGFSAIFGNAVDNETSNLAFFGEAEYAVHPKWTLIGGLRYDTEDQDNILSNFSSFEPEPFPGANQPPSTVTVEADYSVLLPKLSAVYDWRENVSVGLTLQRGYRAGGAAVDFLGAPYEYDPELTNNFELSLRTLSGEGRRRINANLFYTDYTDMQVSLPGPSGTFLDSRIENAGEATLWGFELQSEFFLDSGLSLFANLGYVDTQFDEFIVQLDGAPVDLAGNRFAQAPEWTWIVGGHYQHDSGFRAEADVGYTDRSFYTVNNALSELNKPFTLVNARVGYESGRSWSIYAFARNLFDEQYLSRRRADGFGTAGDSRVVGISLNLDVGFGS